MSIVVRIWVNLKGNRLLPTDSLRLRLTTATFWSLIGAIVTQGLAIGSSVIIARILGQSGFGELGIINSTINMFGVFAAAGLGITATKYVAEFRTKDPHHAGLILGLSRLSAVVVGGSVSIALFITAPIVGRMLNAPQLTDDLRLASGLLLLNALMVTQIGALAGFENFKSIARLSLLRGVVAFILTITGVWLFGLIGGIGAMVLAGIAGWGLGERVIREVCRRADVRVIYQGSIRQWPVLWKYSLPAFLSAVVVALAIWIGNASLVNQTNGYAEMGLFNAANQWRMAILFIPGVIGQVALPILSNLFGMGAIDSYRKTLWLNLAVVFVVSLLLSIPIIVFSPSIMSLYGSDFASGSSVLVIMICSTVLSASIGVIGSAMSSIGKMWQGFILNTVWAVVFVLLA